MALPAFNSLPKKQQLYVVLGVPAAISLIILFFTWKDLGTLGPIDNDIEEGNKLPAMFQRKTPTSVWADIRTTNDNIKQQEEIIAKAPKVKADLAALEADIKAAQERLPRETEKTEMREVIERLAREIPKDIGTVELKSVHIIDDNGERNGKMRTITFQTEITGDTDGILQYIDSLEKNRRFMSVNSLSIRGGGVQLDSNTKKPVFGLHSVHMDIVTYVYNPGAKR